MRYPEVLGREGVSCSYPKHEKDLNEQQDHADFPPADRSASKCCFLLVVDEFSLLIGPSYNYKEFLPKHVMRNMSRFRSHAHPLAVESSIWRGGNGHCAPRGECFCADVQNDVHVLFHCQEFVCALRKKCSLLFPFASPFLWRPHYILRALPSQAVLDFFSQRHNMPFHLRHCRLIFGHG